jgi:hypothetical protein
MGEAKDKAKAISNGRYACCGNCVYFKRAVPMQPVGTCHEKPPTVILLGFAPPRLAGKDPEPRTGSFWPMTADTEVCGNHPNFVTVQTIPEIDLSKLDTQEIEGTA